MLLGFYGEGREKPLAQGRGIDRRPEGGQEVGLEVIAEAGAEPAVGGDPHLVAAGAEMLVRDRADESHRHAAAAEAKIAGGTEAEGIVDDIELVLAGESPPHFGDRQEVFLAEHLAHADGHEFDETNGDIELAGKIEQGKDLLLVFSAHEDGVDLHAGAQRLHQSETGDHGRDLAAGDGAVTRRVQRVEADVQMADAGGRDRLAERGELEAVRGELHRTNAGLRDEGAQQFDDAGPDEGFAAGDAEAGEAQRGSRAHDAKDFRIGQHIGGGQPAPIRLRHAVETALVAAVGDRKTQVIDRPAKGVVHGVAAETRRVPEVRMRARRPPRFFSHASAPGAKA